MISMGYNKGSSLITFLLALTLFSAILLVFQKWSEQQTKQAQITYQRYQAIQIAENQKQRQMFGLGCQSKIEMNGLQFRVHCQNNQISVTYPMGEIAW
ncbi:hypothetical protein GVX81_01875 [[Haemophilus] felis]|uniref:Uncharacterized protein n=1 Tax=[Haemophilus] felis TaxID=123822 RepID=A0A1T0BBU0_9PAST|nr:hypothetical protein [[Haemophilus] felis]NBI39978.1 hypothetical protein [[Haemophilus] felis]NBI41908.1 hypothetical protein [[Haemophilus] felis]OOS07587.1 hypothetical protein B0188_00480 [[Haemophilus] felis]